MHDVRGLFILINEMSEKIIKDEVHYLAFILEADLDNFRSFIVQLILE